MNKITPWIVYKSVLTTKDIEKRNIQFADLSDEGKRLEIAWEALQMVVQEEVDASNGCYWSDSLREIKVMAETSKDFQKALVDELPQCYVCQRGLMMLAQIRLGNHVHPEDSNASDGSIKNIQGFEYDDFLNMEREYEHNAYGHPYDDNTTEKLANICCNILVNGNFDINDGTDYLNPWTEQIR